MQERLSRSDQARSSDRPSITVARLPSRTTAPHGITGPELERLSGAVRFLTLHCQGRRTTLWLATTNKGAARSAIADVWKRITRLQKACSLPAYSVAVLETRGGLHAHITFIGTRAIARRLQSSSVFGELIDARPVTDSNGLVRKYLSKESTAGVQGRVCLPWRIYDVVAFSVRLQNSPFMHIVLDVGFSML
jgi:hypothetical protein